MTHVTRDSSQIFKWSNCLLAILIFDNATCGRPSSNTCISRFRQMPNAWWFFKAIYSHFMPALTFRSEANVGTRPCISFPICAMWSTVKSWHKRDVEKRADWRRNGDEERKEKKKMHFLLIFFFRLIEIFCCQTRNIVEHFPAFQAFEWVKSRCRVCTSMCESILNIFFLHQFMPIECSDSTAGNLSALRSGGRQDHRR